MSRNAYGLTPRQERFCRAFVEQGGAAYAARLAGYAAASARYRGYRLLQDERIKARLRAIRAEMAEEAGRGADMLIGKLEGLYRRAVESGDLATAARIVEGQARLAGLARAARVPEEKGPQKTTKDHTSARKSAGFRLASRG